MAKHAHPAPTFALKQINKYLQTSSIVINQFEQINKYNKIELVCVSKQRDIYTQSPSASDAGTNTLTSVALAVVIEASNDSLLKYSWHPAVLSIEIVGATPYQGTRTSILPRHHQQQQQKLALLPDIAALWNYSSPAHKLPQHPISKHTT